MKFSTLELESPKGKQEVTGGELRFVIAVVKLRRANASGAQIPNKC